MDDLDRLYRRLVQNIRATRPEYLQIPFTVQDLYEQLIPYRHNRRELAIETNQDYEVAVARLLSGERGYVRTEPAMQEALQRELASPTGDSGIFKEYAQTPLSLAAPPDGVKTPVDAVSPETTLAGDQQRPVTPAGDDPITPHVTPHVTPREETQGTTPPPVPSLLSSLTRIEVPTGCKFCGGTLPEERDAHYCPHCGENLKTQRCPACGAEMDPHWKFCITCGRRGE